ncbi:hypothetical protein ABBQ38_004399 [Trebouxia sp. C0009 RCD-2024]
MRQLAQAEVDWNTFRSAVEPGTEAPTDPAVECLHLPYLAETASSPSLADCSPTAAGATNVSLRLCNPLCSPRSPRSQDRPYTARTVVSRQPLQSSTECPCYVSSLYKSNQQAKAAGLQHVTPANSAQSVHSMASEGNCWSSPPQHSSAPPQPYLKAKSGGIALTFGSRQHDRPDSSKSQTLAELPVKGSKSHRTVQLMTIMREGSQLAEAPKACSLIVVRSNAWPASCNGYPPGSGLTVRQQACLLGTSPLAKHDKKLAEKYGPWLQDLRSVPSYSPANVASFKSQADAMVDTPDAALAPRLYSMGPI